MMHLVIPTVLYLKKVVILIHFQSTHIHAISLLEILILNSYLCSYVELNHTKGCVMFACRQVLLTKGLARSKPCFKPASLAAVMTLALRWELLLLHPFLFSLGSTGPVSWRVHKVTQLLSGVCLCKLLYLFTEIKFHHLLR